MRLRSEIRWLIATRARSSVSIAIRVGCPANSIASSPPETSVLAVRSASATSGLTKSRSASSSVSVVVFSVIRQYHSFAIQYVRTGANPIARRCAAGRATPALVRINLVAVRARSLRSSAPRAQLGELLGELELLAARDRDEVAIVERLAPDDPRELHRGVAIVHPREQRADG